MITETNIKGYASGETTIGEEARAINLMGGD